MIAPQDDIFRYFALCNKLPVFYGDERDESDAEKRYGK